jgi:hypothetical protein
MASESGTDSWCELPGSGAGELAGSGAGEPAGSGAKPGEKPEPGSGAGEPAGSGAKLADAREAAATERAAARAEALSALDAEKIARDADAAMPDAPLDSSAKPADSGAPADRGAKPADSGDPSPPPSSAGTSITWQLVDPGRTVSDAGTASSAGLEQVRDLKVVTRRLVTVPENQHIDGSCLPEQADLALATAKIASALDFVNQLNAEPEGSEQEMALGTSAMQEDGNECCLAATANMERLTALVNSADRGLERVKAELRRHGRFPARPEPWPGTTGDPEWRGVAPASGESEWWNAGEDLIAPLEPPRMMCHLIP